MDRDEIAQRLTLAILRAAASNQVRLGHGNEYTLPNMAGQAADAIILQAADPLDQMRLLAEGEVAYQKLVTRMTLAASEIPGYQPGVIGEQTLDIALQGLGPFPPFW